MFFSIKAGGYSTPATVNPETHSNFRTHQPGEKGYLDTPGSVQDFGMIYGNEAIVNWIVLHKVPENIDKSFVGPGAVFEIPELPKPLPDIPEVGIPTWAKQILADLKLIKDRLAI